MTFSRFPIVCTLVLSALGLYACGLTNSPADHLTFTAPKGWQGSPGIMGFMQFWKPPRADNQVLMLFKSPKPIAVSDVFNSANLKSTRVEDRIPITICGNQPAELLRAKGTSARGNDSNVEMVMSGVNGTTYFAMYVYPLGSKPNAEAVAAVRELCAKP